MIRMKVNNAINRLIFNKIITIVNILSITRNFFLLDENLENKNTLNPIQEEDHLTEDREKSECAKNNDTNKDACQEDADEDEDEDDDEDTKYKFPDTQIKIDLSGPK